MNALAKTIEEKIGRSGALGVEIQEMNNDLGDTAEGLARTLNPCKDFDARRKVLDGESTKDLDLRCKVLG